MTARDEYEPVQVSVRGRPADVRVVSGLIRAALGQQGWSRESAPKPPRLTVIRGGGDRQ